MIVWILVLVLILALQEKTGFRFSLLERNMKKTKLELYFILIFLFYLGDENLTPENPAIRKSLSSMLTPYIAKQLSNDSPKEVFN